MQLLNHINGVSIELKISNGCKNLANVDIIMYEYCLNGFHWEQLYDEYGGSKQKIQVNNYS
jgi:hypothetical protein